jgi:hypothetical protein
MSCDLTGMPGIRFTSSRIVFDTDVVYRLLSGSRSLVLSRTVCVLLTLTSQT